MPRTGRWPELFPLGASRNLPWPTETGGMYVNIEDKSELVHFDAQKLSDSASLATRAVRRTFGPGD